jgi:hypothetical protein
MWITGVPLGVLANKDRDLREHKGNIGRAEKKTTSVGALDPGEHGLEMTAFQAVPRPRA